MRIGALSAILSAAFLIASACGGGGGGGGSGGGGGGGGGGQTGNRPPTASAGPAQQVFTHALVTLDGTASSDPDGNALTFSWTLQSRPANSLTSLSGANTARPTLRPDTDGDYVVSLVVSDGSLSSPAAAVEIRAATNLSDEEAAENSGLNAVTDSTTNTFALSWVDRLPVGSAYRVEMRTPSGFTPIETLGGLGGVQDTITWRKSYIEPASYRVIALTSNREFPLLSPPPRTAALDILPPDNDPMIIPAVPEPLSGSAAPVHRLPSLEPGSGLRWTFDDWQDLCCDSPVFWDVSQTAPNGTHLLRARQNFGGWSYRDTRALVSTTNADLKTSARVKLSGHWVDVYVRASSGVGVPTVRVDVLGAVQTLSAPNFCASYCDVPGQGEEYWFRFSAEGVIGIPIVSVSASVNGGPAPPGPLLTTGRAYGPDLEVSSPSDGALVSGTLQVEGTASSASGPLQIAASLDGASFLNTSSTNFAGSLSLAGVAPGSHTLTVTARDAIGRVWGVNRSIVVASGTSPAPLPLFLIDSDATLEAVEGDLVLYRKADLTRWLRRIGSPTSVQISNTVRILGQPVLTGDWLYARGTVPSSTAQSIFRFSTATGQPSNLSASDPNFATPQSVSSAPKVEGGYALWRVGDTFVLYNSASVTFTHIQSPSAIAETDQFDFALTGGSPILFYGSSATLTDVIYKWTPTGGSAAFASAASPVQGWFIESDGTNVAYAPRTGAGAQTSYSLTLRAVDGATVLSTVSNGPFTLDAGILKFGTNTVWSVARGQITLAGLPAPKPSRGAASGLYAYFDAPGTYTWNATTGATTLRIQGGPFPVFITGGWMYFKSGEGVYRISIS